MEAILQGMSTLPPDHVAGIAEQWRRERPELDLDPLLVIGRIEWIQARTDAALRPLFADAGLGNGDFNTLTALRRSGSPYALSPGELATAMLVTTGAVTKRIDRLLAHGLVSRGPAASDGRGRIVALTDRGRELVDRLMEQHLANEQRLLAGLTVAERRRLAELLHLLAVSLDGHAPD
jgi:DNA-binding MarR family transcriptional regulator